MHTFLRLTQASSVRLGSASKYRVVMKLTITLPLAVKLYIRNVVTILKFWGRVSSSANPQLLQMLEIFLLTGLIIPHFFLVPLFNPFDHNFY